MKFTESWKEWSLSRGIGHWSENKRKAGRTEAEVEAGCVCVFFLRRSVTVPSIEIELESRVLERGRNDGEDSSRSRKGPPSAADSEDVR